MIPLCAPSFHGNEKRYLSQCIDEGWVSSGSFVTRFEDSLAKFINIPNVLACSNGSAALEIALKVLGVKKGDEVIVPTLTFIASVNSIIHCGAKPIFMDCEQDCNISIEKTINFINNHTVYKNGHTYNIKTNNIVRAITVVHVFGNSIRFSELLNLCKVRNIKIIEDAAESLGSYNNEFNQKIHTGGIGDIGCFSFNGNKIITTGGGGAIASHSKELIDKARYLINQAKDDPVFYIHNEVGFNYRLSNLSAALGQAQIENLDKILLQKSKIHTIYCNLLDSSKMLSIIHPSSHSISNFWLNVISIHKKSFNLRLVIDKMFEAGIEVRPIWHANNLQSVFSHYESFQIELAPSIISSSLCLPSSFSLTEDQQYYIINTLQDILN